MWLGTIRLALKKVTIQMIRRWIEDGHFEDICRQDTGITECGFEKNPFSSSIAASPVENNPVAAKPRINCYAINTGTALSSVTQNQGSVSNDEDLSHCWNDPCKESIHAVATTSDRLTLSGYPITRHIIEFSGSSMELLEQNDEVILYDIRTLVAYTNVKKC